MKWHLSEEIIIRANISSSTQLSEGFYQIPGESRINLYLDIGSLDQCFCEMGCYGVYFAALEQYKCKGRTMQE